MTQHYQARLNRAGTKVICGHCNGVLADWIDLPNDLPGFDDQQEIQEERLRQARFPEGVGFDPEEGVWTMSNRARRRLGDGEPARQFASNRVPFSGVRTPVHYSAQDIVVWFESKGVPMQGSTHAGADITTVREQANPPFMINCPHCRMRNEVDV